MVINTASLPVRLLGKRGSLQVQCVWLSAVTTSRGAEQVGAKGKESCRSGCLESMRNQRGNVDGKEEFQAFPPQLQLVTCQQPTAESMQRSRQMRSSLI